MLEKNQNKNLITRPPIVVVLGHVDHGKTSLLDFIRINCAKAAPNYRGEPRPVTGREAGGITQSIGAYVIKHNSKEITFIDTPGHQAFSRMRQRGAKLADLGILVVAADEGVKPQTKEAIEILNESKTPFVVAINKTDKPSADVEKMKEELMSAGVLLEGFGGNVSWQAISAKTGEGIDELLDLILLAAELENLTYNPKSKAAGIIIEAKMDRRRGLTAIGVVKDGALKLNDEIATPSASGKVKILENFLGERVKELLPSNPALIIGFETLPQIGEEFSCGKEDFTGEGASKKEEAGQPAVTGDSEEEKINLILKADVSGSLEAFSEVIKNFPDVKIISEEIGDITDGDVKSAQNTKAIIVGFKTRVSKAAETLAKSQDVKIIVSEVIYELLKNLEIELGSLRAPEISGQLEILAVFGKKSGRQPAPGKGEARPSSERRQVIGGKVTAGSLKNNSIVKIQKNEEIAGEGKIINLQRQKQDVSQVKEGEECGILLESDLTVNAGDKLIHETSA